MLLNLIDELRDKFQHQSLPGLDAQMKMAPPMRTRDMQVPSNVRLGAVLILVFEIDKKWNTLLIRRTEDGQTHSGQISFPGGKKDPSDRDLIHTALRECEEEISVLRKDVEVLGTLTPLYIPPSNFLVTPVVGHIKELQNYKASEREVQEIIQTPLELLFWEETKSEKEVLRSDDPSVAMTAPVYKLADDIVIWGATAMMISELETLILQS
ncbi:MAG: CoA pyrophosphatase [Chitinophagaceae bacterium]|nr:CoA pyrophosphatase [Chitinophagaceae bacterium]